MSAWHYRSILFISKDAGFLDDISLQLDYVSLRAMDDDDEKSKI